MAGGVPPAPGEDCSIALAFVNTRHRRGRAIVDDLGSAEALAGWVGMRLATTIDGPIAEVELDRFHSLRAAIASLMHAAARGAQPQASALGLVNQASAAAPRSLQLQWPGAGAPTRRVTSSAPDPLHRAAGEIANDAIELLTGTRRSDLVECAGPGCVRFLVKDHPRRHWCSPGCGERARAARYYQRRRGAADGY